MNERDIMNAVVSAIESRPKSFNGWRQTITIIVSVCTITAGASFVQYNVLASRIERHEIQDCHSKSCELISRLDERTKMTLGIHNQGHSK